MMILLALLACTAPSDPVDTAPTAPQPAELAEPSGTCPAVPESGGWLELTSADEPRQALIFYPSGETEGLPLLYVWHFMGGSAQSMDNYLDLQAQADALGIVIVAPEARPDNIFEWEFVNESDHDVVLFDDLRTCLHQDLGVDLFRVYTTGISAGALWSSYLTIHRAESLAASLIISGGTYPVVEYDEPEADIPVLMFHGGSSDTVSNGSFTLDFQQATLAFAEDLAEDVTTAIVCAHDRGHTLPPSGITTFETFLLKHRFGEPSPYASGDLTGLPEGCVTAASL